MNAFLDIAKNENYEIVSGYGAIETVLWDDHWRGSAMLYFMGLLRKGGNYYRTVNYSGVMEGQSYGVAKMVLDERGAIQDDPLYTKLKSYFEPEQAIHITQAVSGRCSYFLTLEKQRVIDRAAEHAEFISRLCRRMVFVSPDQLQAIFAAHE
ncbi:MAG: hypothetical protein RIC85_00950 [Gammaproteobacteria bacterium]